MDPELEPVFEQIMEAVSAEDLFGVTNVVLPADELLKRLKAEYEKLKSVTGKNWSNLGDAEAAQDAEQKLKQLYQEGQQKIREGVFGLGNTRLSGTRFSTGRREYILGPKMAEGEICTVFEGACVMGSGQAGEVIIKVVNDDADNGLARNEIRTLQGLHNTPAVQWKHLPFLLDVFETERRVGIILRKFRGFTLEQVRQHPRYRKGVDKKHMVWMLNRSLSALGFVHSQGYVHCNLCPEHVMVEPVNHNACLIDWSYSAFKPVLSHEDFRVFNLDFSAPEVKERLEKGRRDDLLPYPTADIYSLGKVMIWLLGGNPATNEMPDDVEDELQRFLLSFVIESKQQRPDNAWELHRQLISLVERLWGPRKYLQFLMD